jgi:bacterial/archaeal transporter family-2 protein
MDRSTAVLLTVVAGGAAALQPVLNSAVGKEVGTWQSALLNFVVGAAALAVLVLLVGGGFGAFRHSSSVPWYYLVGGGLCGVVIVTSLLLTVRTLGAGPVTAAVITGQLGLSLVIDQFGWLGVDRRPLSLAKVAGIVLLVAGTYLVVRE